MGEIQYFFGEEQPDKDYIQEVAHIKRLLEYCTMVPGFQQHFTENPQAALAEAGLSIDKVTVSMTFTGYDNVDKIDIPQEARDAEELEVEE